MNEDKLEEKKLRDFLGNICIGDYVWVQYWKRQLFRWKVRDISGFVVCLDPTGIYLGDDDPLCKDYKPQEYIDRIIDFRKLRNNNYYNPDFRTVK